MYKMVYKNGEPVFNNRSGNQVVGSYDYNPDILCPGFFLLKRKTRLHRCLSWCILE